MKKLNLFFLCCLQILTMFAQELPIIPLPSTYEWMPGKSVISKATVIVAKNAEEQSLAALINEFVEPIYGFKFRVENTANANSAIQFNITPQHGRNDEAYTLEIKNNQVFIAGYHYTGVFYGIQSFLQLLPLEKFNSFTINNLLIKDEPRFAYRGMHLDVGRHFFPVSFIKKYINYIAMHKMNVFHWHLTEDQGWRIEIKKYPKLTEVGAYRNGTIVGRYPGTSNTGQKYGGYYTQEEIKDIVAYAAARKITVIPEIELPGHSSAAIAAYPQLSCFPEEATKRAAQSPWYGDTTGKQVQQTWGVFEDVFCPTEFTFQFLQDVFDEVMQLFPYKYIHIGGDECPKESWKRTAFCQDLIQKNNLKDEHELQSYFIQRIEKYLNSKGRNIIGWDEILEGGLAPNATVMSWRGEAGGIEAAKQKHNVIMTPGSHCYFDHSQSRNEDSVTIGGFTTVEKVYAYEPIPKELSEEEGKYVLGAQGNVWTEYMTNPSKVEYMIFPRMSALSEVLWTPKNLRDPLSFEKRLMHQFNRFDFLGIQYSKAFFEIQSNLSATQTHQGVQVDLKTNTKNATIQYQINSSKPFQYKEPFTINQSGTLKASVLLNGKSVSTTTLAFQFNKATGQQVQFSTPPANNYRGNGGNFGIVNGLWAKGFNSNEWLGWQGKDPIFTFLLNNASTIQTITVGTWYQPSSWVHLPSAIMVWSSNDGQNWQPVDATLQIQENRKAIIHLKTPVKTAFLKLKINHLGKIPEGLPGAGNPAWLFIDEIAID